MPLEPVALYGLHVPRGEVLVPAHPDFPATLRITMAAIDPSEAAVQDDGATTTTPRATLRILRQPLSADDEDEENEEYMRAILAEDDSDEESEEEANGGPSDPAKSKKARKEAALAQLMASIGGGDDSDEEMEDATVKATKKDKKGKAKATSDDGEEDSEDESDDDESDFDIEEFVVCTLDPEKHYQQTLDITIGEREQVFFKVSGTHDVYLTGNYVQQDDGHNHHHEVYDSDDDEDDEDYDLSPDEDEIEGMIDDESDDLDGLEDPRITEIESEDEAPKLVEKANKKDAKKEDKKGKNKRSADDLEEPATLDDIMAKTAEEPKLSKKQLKKLKKNNGEAVAAKPEEAKETKKEESKDGSAKKVQFAKNLELGPTGSADKTKKEIVTPVKEKENKKAGLGVKVINGIKIDDKKLGSGPAAKNGDRVGMRYIGKLVDGKVFDSNKAGKPFSFKLGKGEVIKGWDIGVAGMAVGGERRLTIPANHAYGGKALPGIPANSTLVFDIKLLEIK